MNRTTLRNMSPVLVLVLAGCSSAPRYQNGPPAGTSVTIENTAVSVEGRDVVQRAEAFLGAPYRYGGTSVKGLDCSGLVYTVFRDFGIAVPRTSRDQSGFGTKIARGNLQAGDLVFFHTGRGSRVTHVGIYAGRGEFIHASTRSRRVKFDRLDNKYFRNRYVSARRVL
ncbi:MAG: C40 family peptidase [Candidatus Krumholzibacteriota bacterium]|nr:C40 family peptidase [Candidatus Krumholzibacteriota bacterium]